MAFAILVSMLVSFTLTPMLSSRFLKVADAEQDQKTKHQRLFHWLDRCVQRARCAGRSRTRWRSSASSVVAGRADDPAEPDGRPHVRAGRGHGRVHRPCRHAAGHLARGHDGDRPEHGEGDRRTGRRRARRLPRGRRSRTHHFHLFFYLLPLDERKATQDQVMAAMRRILARIRRTRRASSARNPARRRRRQLRRSRRRCSVPISASSTTTRSRSSRRPSRRRASSTRIRLQQRQPRGAGGRGSVARRRPGRAHGDGGQHAAADGGGRRRDLDAIAKRASSIR